MLLMINRDIYQIGLGVEGESDVALKLLVEAFATKPRNHNEQ